jgi:hypothetical protein
LPYCFVGNSLRTAGALRHHFLALRQKSALFVSYI